MLSIPAHTCTLSIASIFHLLVDMSVTFCCRLPDPDVNKVLFHLNNVITLTLVLSGPEIA